MCATKTKTDPREFLTAHNVPLGTAPDGTLMAKTTCPRCGGSGHYSRCEMYGTRCFTCNVASDGKLIGVVWEKADKVMRRLKRQKSAQAKRERELAAKAVVEAAERAVNGGLTNAELDDLQRGAEAALVAEEAAAVEAARKAVSQYVGTVGERGEFRVKLQAGRILNFDGYYGSRWLVRFVDESGNKLTWWASDIPGEWVEDEYKAGKWFTIKASVKAHDDYKGEKQTVLTRVKEVGVSTAPVTIRDQWGNEVQI